jgi:secondary thiamine-phosphate synthase enzyme
MVEELLIETQGQGLLDITHQVKKIVAISGKEQGLCTVFVTHTSASLTIQENADPSARRDLENWLNRLVPENDALYTHTTEGKDDMPAHIKAILTSTSLSIPIINGRLGLGIWQGLYLWEHRRMGHRRRLLVHVSK